MGDTLQPNWGHTGIVLGVYWDEMGCTGMGWGVLGWDGSYWDEMGVYWDEMGWTGMRWGCTGMRWVILGLGWGCTGMRWGVMG